MSEPVQGARPVVKVNGREEAIVTERVLGLRMDEQAGGLSSFEMRLLNLRGAEDATADLAFSNETPITLGVSLEVNLGDEADATPMFKGVITALEEVYGGDGPPEFIVLAEDLLHRARLNRRTKVHTDVTVEDLVRDVAEAAGLRGSTTGLGGSIPVEVQLNESDLAFLRRVLAARDGELQVVDGELQVAAVTSIHRDDITIDAQTGVRRLRVAVDIAHQVSAVTVAGWDSAQGSNINVTSSPSEWGPGSGRKGGDVLAGIWGERKEHVGHGPVLNDTEAQAVADAAHVRRARRFVQLEATVAGDARIRVGAHVRLTGTSGRFANTYQVVRACHVYDLANGYETSFEAECAFMGEAS